MTLHFDPPPIQYYIVSTADWTSEDDDRRKQNRSAGDIDDDYIGELILDFSIFS